MLQILLLQDESDKSLKGTISSQDNSEKREMVADRKARKGFMKKEVLVEGR